MSGQPRFPQFPIRVEPILIKKIRYIASENCRSASKEIELLMRKHVRDYESTYGEITEEDLTSLSD